MTRPVLFSTTEVMSVFAPLAAFPARSVVRLVTADCGMPVRLASVIARSMSFSVSSSVTVRAASVLAMPRKFSVMPLLPSYTPAPSVLMLAPSLLSPPPPVGRLPTLNFRRLPLASQPRRNSPLAGVPSSVTLALVRSAGSAADPVALPFRVLAAMFAALAFVTASFEMVAVMAVAPLPVTSPERVTVWFPVRKPASFV